MQHSIINYIDIDYMLWIVLAFHYRPTYFNNCYASIYNYLYRVHVIFSTLCLIEFLCVYYLYVLELLILLIASKSPATSPAGTI